MALIVVRISTSNWSNWGLHFSKSISTIRSLFFFGFIGAWRALLKLELREKFSTDEVVWIEASLTIQGCSSGFTRNASKKVWCQTWTRTNLKNLNKSTTSCTCLLHFRPILHDTVFDLGPVCKSRYEHCTSQNMLEFHDSRSTHGIQMLCQLTLCWLLAESLRNECQRGDQGQQIDTRVGSALRQVIVCVWLRRMSHVAKKKTLCTVSCLTVGSKLLSRTLRKTGSISGFMAEMQAGYDSVSTPRFATASSPK